MKIDTLKDLEAMLKICRKQAVESIKIDNIEIKLGELQPKLATTSSEPTTETELTDEQLLFYSSTGQ